MKEYVKCSTKINSKPTMATSTVREVIVGRQRKKRPLCLCVSGSGEMAPVVCYPKSHLLHWPSQITEASVINLVTRPINFSFHQHGPRTFWHTQTCACVHRCTFVMHICVCITHNCVSLFFSPPHWCPYTHSFSHSLSSPHYLHQSQRSRSSDEPAAALRD